MLSPALITILVVASALAMEARPLAIRCWQFQDYNMDHIKRLVDLAAAANVNRVQLSHNIVMDVEEPLAKPQLVADINTICKWAHDKGIEVDMWTHELNVPREQLKDGKVDVDDPKLWEFVKGKYDKLFKLCPEIDGLVLTMQETAQSIYNDAKVSSSISPEQRVAKLIDDMGSVCAAFKKDFIVRTFSYEPEQLRWILGGLKLCKSDVIVMTKCVPHDWQPYYPFNPAIGDVGGKRQIVEFDLGHEFTGLSTIPYINIDYVKRHLDHDIKKNAIGAVYRLERLAWRSTDTPNWAVIDVGAKLLSDPTADPHKLYREWLAERYGKDAVEPLFSAFMRTQEIVDKGYFVLGYWVTNHSLIPAYDYAEKSLHGRTTAKWDPSTKPIEQELFNPTRDTIRKIDAEKDAALKLADASIADVERAKFSLKPDDYRELKDLFERERAMVIVWKAAMDVIFGIDVCKSTSLGRDSKSRPSEGKQFLLQAADRLEKLTGENRTHLINMAADYKDPKRSVNVDRALELVELARKAEQL